MAITYIHLMFDRHEIIFAENVGTESLYPGPMAFDMFAPDTKKEFRIRFPELAGVHKVAIQKTYGQTIRPVSASV